MSWFPNYQSLEDTELSNAAFLAMGKALHICHLFESTCKWVLQVDEAVGFMKKNEEASLKDAFDNFKEKWLSQTIKSLGQINDIKENDIDLLKEAVEARNYIAHEGSLFFAAGNRWLTIARLKRLRREVERLAKGANIAFLWSYEIENRRPGPKTFFEGYPKLVEGWVFGDLIDLLNHQESHPSLLKAEKSLLEYDQTMNKRKGISA
jgi:hypothetical protein